MILAVITIIAFFFLNTIHVSANSLQLNEFMPHPSSGSDWIELYNSTSSSIDLTGWTLVDNTSTMKTLSGAIPSNAFVTFDVSNRLNNGGDSIYLKDSSGSTIDIYSYSSDPGTDKSIGRSPDGGSWTILASSSKGSSNGGAVSTPTPSPTPSPSSPSPSPTSSSSFTVSGVPSQINSDQSFNISVNLSLPKNPDTTYYLAGAFKIVDGTRYFGLTKTASGWTEYSSKNFSNQYKIITNSSGSWVGNLEIKPDATDSDYKGSGDYVFRVARYTSSGSGPTWSNETTIKIVSVETLEQGIASTSYTSKPSPTKLTMQTSEKSTTNFDYQLATVAAATASATAESTEVKSQKQINYISWVGILLMITGIGIFAYVYLRNSTLREAISNLLRKRN